MQGPMTGVRVVGDLNHRLISDQADAGRFVASPPLRL